MEEASWFDNPKLVQRHGCVFQAYGMDFEPEAFLRDTTFDRKQILFHGVLNLPGGIKGKIAGSDFFFETESRRNKKTSPISAGRDADANLLPGERRIAA